MLHCFSFLTFLELFIHLTFFSPNKIFHQTVSGLFPQKIPPDLDFPPPLLDGQKVPFRSPNLVPLNFSSG